MLFSSFKNNIRIKTYHKIPDNQSGIIFKPIDLTNT